MILRSNQLLPGHRYCHQSWGDPPQNQFHIWDQGHRGTGSGTSLPTGRCRGVFDMAQTKQRTQHQSSQIRTNEQLFVYQLTSSPYRLSHSTNLSLKLACIHLPLVSGLCCDNMELTTPHCTMHNLTCLLFPCIPHPHDNMFNTIKGKIH